MSEPNRNFVDDRHALYAGAILGIAMKHGLNLRPCIDTEGNYTNHLRLSLEDPAEVPVVIELIVPPPPDDWSMADWLD